MNKLLLLAMVITMPLTFHAQNECTKRTFIASVSQFDAGFFVMTYGSDLLDSLRWNFGDGTIVMLTENVGSGNGNHTYNAAGSYNVTLEQWGKKEFPENTTPYYCSYTHTIDVYDYFTDSICGGDFLISISGNVATFSNTSVIHAPGYNSHPDHPLWEFGNGLQGIYLNRLYDVPYDDGTYTACLYYNGFSYNDNGYTYNCKTCKTFTIGNSTVSVNEQNTIPMELFPNPVANELTLRSDRDLKSIEVTDLCGKQFNVEISRSGKDYRLLTNSLKAGSYLVSCETDEGTIVRTFVKD